MRARLRSRRLTVWAGLGAALLSLLAAGAYRKVYPGAVVDEAQALAAFERERSVAETLSMVVVAEGTETSSFMRIAFDVPAGACAALVATSWGPQLLSRVRLFEERALLAASGRIPGLVGHAQLCVDRDTTLRGSLTSYAERTPLGQPLRSGGTWRWAALVGRPPGGATALNRGLLTRLGAERIPEADILRRADAWAATRTAYGPALRVGTYRARLVPETPATYARLRELAANGNGLPRPIAPHLDPLPDTLPASWRTLTAAERTLPDDGVAVPAMAFQDDRPLRVLAVVDAEALGRCVEVQLIRMAWGMPTAARRLDRPRPLEAQRPLSFITERLCARAVYVTEGADATDYQLRLYETETPAGTPQAEQTPSSAGNGAEP